MIYASLPLSIWDGARLVRSLNRLDLQKNIR